MAGSRMLGGAAAVVAVAAIAVSVVVRDDGGDRPPTSDGPVPTTTVAPGPAAAGPDPGGTLPIAGAPISARSDAITAWTGKEMLVWRGMGETTDVCVMVDKGMQCGDAARTDGARYDPATDSWTPMAESPMPAEPASSVESTVGAWTGTELVVWGGPGPDAAAYDPATDSWRTLDPGPLDARNGAVAVWSGSEMVVVGGVPRAVLGGGGDDPQPAAAFDPATDTWRELPAPPGTARSWGTNAVWTGAEVVVAVSKFDDPLVLALMDPAVGSWAEVSVPALHGASSMTVLGAGSDEARLVVTGTDAEDWSVDVAVSIPVDGLGEHGWTASSTIANGFDNSVSAVAGDGEVFMVMAPSVAIPDEDRSRAIVFDPASGEVEPLDLGGFDERNGPAMAWTGTELLVWGGGQSTGYGSTPLRDGVRYRPPE